MYFFFLPKKYKKGLYSLAHLFLLLLITVILVTYPKLVFPAAKRGLEAWWQVVMPGLFPFFITVELLLKFGVVQFLGVLLEPIMRPLFNIPGNGAFILTAGFTSGAPIGGILTAKLYHEKLIDREEAARLVSFTNNASPLFILGSVSIGFLGQPQLGRLLAFCHYLANLLIGLLLKILSPKKVTGKNTQRNLLVQAFTCMHHVYRSNAKPLGSLLGEVIKSSMEKMLIIGGFIISFSVLIEVLSILGVLNLIAKFLGTLLIPIGIDPSLMLPLASGIFEMTIGIKMVTESNAPLFQQLLCISLILGWAGLSVHAQVAAFISDQKVPLVPYFFARILQGILAALLTYFFITKNLFVLSTSRDFLNSSYLSSIILVSKILFVLTGLYLIILFFSSGFTKVNLHKK